MNVNAYFNLIKPFVVSNDLMDPLCLTSHRTSKHCLDVIEFEASMV